jgi:hypothetical protein
MRVPQIDHLVEPGSEKMIGRHRLAPCFRQDLKGIIFYCSGILMPNKPPAALNP